MSLDWRSSLDHRYAENEGPTAEQQIRGSDAAANWILLLSGYDPDVVQKVVADGLSSTALKFLGAKEKSTMGCYTLSFATTPLD
jgi:hypothetical protein